MNRVRALSQKTAEVKKTFLAAIDDLNVALDLNDMDAIRSSSRFLGEVKQNLERHERVLVRAVRLSKKRETVH